MVVLDIRILFFVLPGGGSIEQIRYNKNMVKVSLDQFFTEEDFNPIRGYVSMAFYYKHKPTYSIHINSSFSTLNLFKVSIDHIFYSAV